MKIYLLYNLIENDEYDYVYGVFSTLDKVKEYVEKHDNEPVEWKPAAVFTHYLHVPIPVDPETIEGWHSGAREYSWRVDPQELDNPPEKLVSA